MVAHIGNECKGSAGQLGLKNGAGVSQSGSGVSGLRSCYGGQSPG